MAAGRPGRLGVIGDACRGDQQRSFHTLLCQYTAANAMRRPLASTATQVRPGSGSGHLLEHAHDLLELVQRGALVGGPPGQRGVHAAAVGAVLAL